MKHYQHQLIIDSAKALGLNIQWTTDELGNPRIQSKDKVELFKAYIDLLEEEIVAREKLILVVTDYGTTIRNTVETCELKRNVLDLKVELIAKMDYVTHYQGRVKFYTEAREKILQEATDNIGKYIDELERILETKHEPNKKNAILTGIYTRMHDGLKDDNELIATYTQLKNLIGIL